MSRTRGSRRRSALVTQLTLLTTAVAVLAVLVTFAVAFPLLRESAERQAQSRLGSQADLVADLVEARSIATAAVEGGVPELRTVLADEGIDVDVVASIEDVPALLTAGDREVLADGGEVSGVRSADGRRYLVEARAAFPFAWVVVSQPASEARNSVESASVRRLGLALLVGLLIAAVAGALIARGVTRPLVHVRAAAYRLGHGDRSVQVEPEGPREVAEVADALNALTDALATSEARQREFLLSVSHELRTPLTAVRGYAEALADGVVAGDEVAPTGAVVRAEADRLDRLVSDLLDLARLGAVDLRLDLEPVDVEGLLADAGRVWTARGAAVEVEVVTELPVGGLTVVTDPTRLRQVLDNLAENALRVTPSGQRLYLAARSSGPAEAGSWVLEVRDHGPGLTPDDIAVAFEPAALYERYRGVRQVGSGVGLALVARLAARLGGRAEADVGSDGGAVLRVVLPVAGPQDADGAYDRNQVDHRGGGADPSRAAD